MAHAEKPVILFDGVCNYCNSMVNFIIRQDKQQKFLFAPLQSQAGQQLLMRYKLPQAGFNSFVLIDNNEVYLRSSASLQLFNKLPWYWKWTQVLWIVPKFLRDGAYNLVARNRYKWFGKTDSCMIPTPELKTRFLD